MEACCVVVVCLILGYVIIQIMIAASKASDEKQREINTKKYDLERKRNTLNSQLDSLKMQEKSFYDSVKCFFGGGGGTYASVYGSAMNTIKIMESQVTAMKETISLMRRANAALVSSSRREDQSEHISNEEEAISQKAPQAISRVNHMAESFKAFGEKVHMLPASKMMDDKKYGNINKKYWDYVSSVNRANAANFLEKCENLLNSTEFDEIYKLDINAILDCVWIFAIEKTFSASDFKRAKSVFYRIYKENHVDVIIADLYAKKKVGGEEVLRDSIRELLKVQHSSEKLTLIASSLMWMNAYQSESMVLQHMLTTGKEMNAKTQERLHSLTNGGGKAPTGFNVRSSDNYLYFDVSALAWKDDEYIGLFENLTFQDRILTYSLAVRDENKDLFIAQGINVPSTRAVLAKLKNVFADGYSSVTAQIVNSIALSGSGEERMEGILVTTKECKQMGILMHVVRIGKKLIIKFYTLFMPTGADLAVQKQQALSMYKKLSLPVTSWESSLKDAMLMAVEQLLNANAMSGAKENDKTPESDVAGFDEPIF